MERGIVVDHRRSFMATDQDHGRRVGRGGGALTAIEIAARLERL